MTPNFSIENPVPDARTRILLEGGYLLLLIARASDGLWGKPVQKSELEYGQSLSGQGTEQAKIREAKGADYSSLTVSSYIVDAIEAICPDRGSEIRQAVNAVEYCRNQKTGGYGSVIPGTTRTERPRINVTPRHTASAVRMLLQLDEIKSTQLEASVKLTVTQQTLSGMWPGGDDKEPDWYTAAHVASSLLAVIRSNYVPDQHEACKKCIQEALSGIISLYDNHVTRRGDLFEFIGRDNYIIDSSDGLARLGPLLGEDVWLSDASKQFIRARFHSLVSEKNRDGSFGSTARTKLASTVWAAYVMSHWPEVTSVSASSVDCALAYILNHNFGNSIIDGQERLQLFDWSALLLLLSKKTGLKITENAAKEIRRLASLITRPDDFFHNLGRTMMWPDPLGEFLRNTYKYVLIHSQAPLDEGVASRILPGTTAIGQIATSKSANRRRRSMESWMAIMANGIAIVGAIVGAAIVLAAWLGLR